MTTEDQNKLWRYLVQDADPVLVKRYCTWIRRHPEVLAAFMDKAQTYWMTGRRRCSGWLICNVLRWETELASRTGEWKMPNDYIAMLTRHAIAKRPEWRTFFELRPMTKRRGTLPRASAQPQEYAR